MAGSRYRMRISLNVLNHLGMHLYSNTPPVLAEAIANAWDADATEVRVQIDRQARAISVRDNGVGMDLADVNEKFLYVGYRKRPSDSSFRISKGRNPAGGKANDDFRTPKGRKPMGRKGIGKLSLFSIANRISVYTKKAGGQPESFRMDAHKIRKAIEAEDPSTAEEYKPERIKFDQQIAEGGTILKIEDLKKIRLTQATVAGLKKRIARRFSVLADDFRIYVNGEEVSFQDRDYFHKARFIYQYGRDYAQHCANLDTDSDTGKQMKFDRTCRFDGDGKADCSGTLAIKGWIAIARRSNDLDGDSKDDNLNKIAIVVRGKVAQEDILQDFRLGGMITKYMFGEINADFLDEDDKDDIATSSRQSISEDDPRFKALKSFLRSELNHIWTETNKLKEKKGLENALEANPPLKEWYQELPKRLQPRAAKIFAEIDKANIDESSKRDFYANGVLAFERLKMNSAMEMLDSIDESNLKDFLEFLADVDAIEAANYREIVNERLKVIRKLQQQVTEDARERVLQEYIFDHLWLLDPAWERATQYKNMEQRIQAAMPGGAGKETTLRTDIRYRRVSAAHVVLELKRGSVRLDKTKIEEQLKRYLWAVDAELKKDPEQSKLPIEGICLIGKLPRGWDNPEERRMDEESLRPRRIRVITYDELINNAESAYAKFLDATATTEKLGQLLHSIRSYTPEDIDS